jgi:hypothetical protein
LNRLKTEKKRILITVKAYPNPSKTYGETVCCAGIDIDSLKWIRLYPIPFRDLDSEQQFKKYSIIEKRVIIINMGNLLSIRSNIIFILYIVTFQQLGERRIAYIVLDSYAPSVTLYFISQWKIGFK